MAFPLVLQLFQVVEYRTSIILHLCDSSTHSYPNSFLISIYPQVEELWGISATNITNL